MLWFPTDTDPLSRPLSRRWGPCRDASRRARALDSPPWMWVWEQPDCACRGAEPRLGESSWGTARSISCWPESTAAGQQVLKLRCLISPLGPSTLVEQGSGQQRPEEHSVGTDQRSQHNQQNGAGVTPRQASSFLTAHRLRPFTHLHCHPEAAGDHGQDRPSKTHTHSDTPRGSPSPVRRLTWHSRPLLWGQDGRTCASPAGCHSQAPPAAPALGVQTLHLCSTNAFLISQGSCHTAPTSPIHAHLPLLCLLSFHPN